MTGCINGRACLQWAGELPGSQDGCRFHMMSALGELGRTGLTAVGNSHEDAKAMYERAVAVLKSGNGRAEFRRLTPAGLPGARRGRP